MKIKIMPSRQYYAIYGWIKCEWKPNPKNGYIFQYIPVCPFTVNIESSFLTEIEFTQLN